MPQIACRVLVVLVMGVFALARPLQPSRAADLRLARFSADVTIPLGHRCMGILPTKAQRIVDPLQVHGVVLLGGKQPIVLAAFDWCEIRNDSHDAWRESIADAAGTTPERVLVSSVHQHDAPVIDSGAQTLLDEVGLEEELFDPAFHQDCLRRVSQAVRDSLSTAQPVTHLGVGSARVRRVASNRRVVHLDRRVSFDRYSAAGGADFHTDAPVGLIDPMLKTVSFWNGDEPLVAINHYAVHPMSYYGQGGVSYDFVGIARERQRRESSVPQIYVSGCSGDVVAGKFNDGSTDSRHVLAERLRDAMQRAWEATERQPLGEFGFRDTTFELPFHESEAFSEDVLLKTLRDPEAETSERILAAMGLSSRQRIEAGGKIDLPCIDLGAAQIVLLPGEAFVGYQVMAQQMRPDTAVIAIGYGECWPGYIPTRAAFEDGFGHGWRWAGRGSEAAIRSALREVLQPTSSDLEQTGKWRQIALPEDVRQRCLHVLQEGLQSDAFWPSMHAAEGLIGAGLGDQPKPLLVSKLQSETDDRRRCGLARELVRAGEKRYAAVLLEILADDSSPGRTHAAESLYKIGEIGDGVALRAAIEQTGDLSLRLMAGAALARAGNPRAMAIIRQSLRSDDEATRRLTAWILGRVGSDSDIPRLRQAGKRTSSPLTKAYVDHALAALGDPGGLAQLTKNLDSEDAPIRTSAAKYAGDARATSVATELIDQLDEEHLDARIRAAQSLLELELPPADHGRQVSYQVFQATEVHPRYSEGSIVELADGSLLLKPARATAAGARR